MRNPIDNYKNLPSGYTLQWDGLPWIIQRKTSGYWAAPGNLTTGANPLLSKAKSVLASSFFSKYSDRDAWNDASPNKDFDSWADPLHNFDAPDIAYRKLTWKYGTPEVINGYWSESNSELKYEGLSEVIHALGVPSTITEGSGSSSPNYQWLYGVDQWFGWGVMRYSPSFGAVWVKNPDDGGPTGEYELTGSIERVEEITADYLKTKINEWATQDYDTALGTAGTGLGARAFTTNSGRRTNGRADAVLLQSRYQYNLTNAVYSLPVVKWNDDYRLHLCILERRMLPIGDSLPNNTKSYYVNGHESQILSNLITSKKWRDDYGTFDLDETGLAHLAWGRMTGPINELLPYTGRVSRALFIPASNSVLYRITLDVITIDTETPGTITVHATNIIDLVTPSGEVFYYPDSLNYPGNATIRCSKVERRIDNEWIEITFPPTLIEILEYPPEPDDPEEPSPDPIVVGYMENPDAFGHLIGDDPSFLILFLVKIRTGERWGHPAYEELSTDPALKSYYLTETYNVRKTP